MPVSFDHNMDVQRLDAGDHATNNLTAWLVIAGSNIKEVHGKPRLSMAAMLRDPVVMVFLRSCVRVHEQYPSHDTHENIHSWVSVLGFLFFLIIYRFTIQA